MMVAARQVLTCEKVSGASYIGNSVQAIQANLVLDDEGIDLARGVRHEPPLVGPDDRTG